MVRFISSSCHMDGKDALSILKLAIPIKVVGGKESNIRGADTRCRSPITWLYDKGLFPFEPEPD
jgi:hypothetical protein